MHSKNKNKIYEMKIIRTYHGKTNASLKKKNTRKTWNQILYMQKWKYQKKKPNKKNLVLYRDENQLHLIDSVDRDKCVGNL